MNTGLFIALAFVYILIGLLSFFLFKEREHDDELSNYKEYWSKPKSYRICMRLFFFFGWPICLVIFFIVGIIYIIKNFIDCLTE